MIKIIGYFLLISTIISYSHGARILGIFHVPSYSHYTLGETLMKALAKRGHHVTMISAYSQKTPVENYRDISIGSKTYFQELENATSLKKLLNCPDLVMPVAISAFSAKMAEAVFENQEVQDLLKSNETFDLVIMEQFFNEAHHGFAYHYNAPIIVASTMGATVWVNHLVGNPALPSVTPHLFLKYSYTMSFGERIYNTLFTIYQHMVDYHFAFPRQSKMLHKYFPDAPDLYDLMSKTSMVFLNNHVSYKTSTSLVPSMVEIGGYHINEVKPLPTELKKFLDEAAEGVVYFSFGSRLKTAELPEDKRNFFLRVFSRLPMKVLWKFEGDAISDISSNILLQKWFPQQSVLAHPNLKIFISHGGMLSTSESVHFGVPVLGIPLQADQLANMAEIVDQGYGKMIAYDDLTEDNLYSALKEMMDNRKYEENVKMRSKIMQDRILKPIDEAVYWTEYVINHKGAHHLKTAAMKLKWYQQYLLDVFAFLVGCIIVSSYMAYICIKYVLCKKQKMKLKVN